ncbi:MAG: efflux RND transporter periplasmic adaptor subunit, partial [Spirochaetes bacterium]|nr:efflux RND transporter periplasmic adaptor subunit [Spirochaetota bacterium]
MKPALPALLLLLLLASCGGKKGAPVLLTAGLAEGPFTESVSESGTLEAVQAADVSTPDISRNFNLVQVVDEGAMVEAGQKIATFDTADAERDLQNMRDKILDKKDEIENLLARQRDELTDSSNSIQATRDGLEMEKINQRSLEFSSDVDKRAGEIKLRSRMDDVGKAERRLATLRLEHARQIRQKQAELRRLEEDRRDKEKEIAACTILAPKGGLIVYRTRNPWTKEKIRAGDTLRRSQNFILIPDLSAMQVKMEVNEVDIHRMRTAMVCDITLDAVPDRPFTGTVIKIGKLAYPKPSNAEIMVFEVIARVNESEPALLRPGMTAKVNIILSRIPRAVYLPLDTIFQANGDVGTVYLLDAGKFRLETVRLGAKNDDFVVVDTKLPRQTVFLLYNAEVEKDPKLDPAKFKIEPWRAAPKTNAAPQSNAQTNRAPRAEARTAAKEPSPADFFGDPAGGERGPGKQAGARRPSTNRQGGSTNAALRSSTNGASDLPMGA